MNDNRLMEKELRVTARARNSAKTAPEAAESAHIPGSNCPFRAQPSPNPGANSTALR